MRCRNLLFELISAFVSAEYGIHIILLILKIMIGITLHFKNGFEWSSVYTSDCYVVKIMDIKKLIYFYNTKVCKTLSSGYRKTDPEPIVTSIMACPLYYSNFKEKMHLRFIRNSNRDV